MSEQSAYPLQWPARWPRTRSPQRSRFGKWNAPPTTDSATQSLLAELKRLGAQRIVISTNVPLRKDGLPYSNVSVDDKGVAIYFRLKDEPRVLACDKWSTIGENIYAIAKTIEATRGIERWGSVTTEQAFAGYAALQEKTQPTCWELLNVRKEGLQLATPEGIETAERIILQAWREKIKTAHPQNGGSEQAFADVNAAKDMALQLIKQ